MKVLGVLLVRVFSAAVAEGKLFDDVVLLRAGSQMDLCKRQEL